MQIAALRFGGRCSRSVGLYLDPIMFHDFVSVSIPYSLNLKSSLLMLWSPVCEKLFDFA